MSLTIKFKKVRENAIAPRKANDTDAGFDVFATERHVIGSGAWKTIPLGIAMAIPPGYCMVAKDRSGLASKNGIHIRAGVIDEDYRGEVCAVVANSGPYEFVVEEGMKIAQMLLIPVPQAKFEEVKNLMETDRGAGGFGSSGLF